MSRFRPLLLPTALAVGLSTVLAAPAASAQSPAEAECDTTSAPYNYVVLYQPRTPQAQVDAELTAKCGDRVAYYPEIGVAVASSRNADFADLVGVHRAYSGAREVAHPATTGAAAARAQARAEIETEETVEVVTTTDVSAEQWDMRMIKAPQANAIDEGSSSVTVGVLDSGIEPTHPALVGALDPTTSAGCNTGAPDTDPAAWAPTTSDHGTHVAGTIAGKDTARGFTGIAPGVRMASVKVVNDDGYIFPEAAVCGFMWAAEHRFDVTNNSYYVDPGMFYCPTQPGDAAAYEAVRRAVAYSHQRGVLNVAAAGNSGFDLTDPPADDPNRGHAVDAGCKILPKSLDDVVTVSAVGYEGTKSSYSNYGSGEVDVTAPGGDRAQLPPEGEGAGCPVSSVFGGEYGTKCGTSMAAPHAAGVAALIASKRPHLPPKAVAALLRAKADSVACDGAEDCTGPAAKNSFYGHGLVDALAAVR
ncbi:S8 family peptidase [Saccharomonospora azurea]|uniref:Subtilisin-like serine protease n=2 Tax=Saccharomonospora azurea TaxID=40988 RepID=H8GC67_9PSEU|nr:S8 family serine peptidase [Saccharomonospora azurea]EHK87434.1 subtilisin-like serine protease [Saccharomonospora azurea SZMC 14600]EHY87744.1 subtilisin-like serine protease [Saccharomonospora azurea NA-128]